MIKKLILLATLILSLSTTMVFADTQKIYFTEHQSIKKYDVTNNTVTTINNFGSNVVLFRLSNTEYLATYKNGSYMNFYYTNDNFSTTNIYTTTITDFPSPVYDREMNWFLYQESSGQNLKYITKSDIIDGGTVTPILFGQYLLPATFTRQNNEDHSTLNDGDFFYTVNQQNTSIRKTNKNTMEFTQLVLQSGNSLYGLDYAIIDNVKYLYQIYNSRLYMYNLGTMEFDGSIEMPFTHNDYISINQDNKIKFYLASGKYFTFNSDFSFSSVIDNVGYQGRMNYGYTYNSDFVYYVGYGMDGTSDFGLHSIDLITHAADRLQTFTYNYNYNFVYADDSFAPPVPETQEYFGFVVQQVGLSYKIVGHTEDLSIVNGKLEIPSTLGAFIPVTDINPDVFINLGITELVIPQNIHVGAGAFRGNFINKITIGDNVAFDNTLEDDTFGDFPGFAPMYIANGSEYSIAEYNGQFWVDGTTGVSLADKIKLILAQESSATRYVYNTVLGDKKVILTSQYPLTVYAAQIPVMKGLDSLISQNIVPSFVALDTAFRKDAGFVTAVNPLSSVHNTNELRLWYQNDEGTEMIRQTDPLIYELKETSNFPAGVYGYIIQLPDGVTVDQVQSDLVTSVDEYGNVEGTTLETELTELNAEYADYLKDNPFSQVAITDGTIGGSIETIKTMFNGILPMFNLFAGMFGNIPYVGPMLTLALSMAVILFVIKLIRG